MTRSKDVTDYVTAPAEYRMDLDRCWARTLFLRAIEEHAPEVLQTLRRRVLPAYRPHHPLSEEDLARFRRDPRSTDAVMDRIGELVVDWADEFGLRGHDPSAHDSVRHGPSLFTWMRDVIVLTLAGWQADPGRGFVWDGLSDLSCAAGLESPDPARPKINGWRLFSETESDFRDRARRDFESWLEQYVRTKRRKMTRATSFPTRLARNHFGYLAAFQCLRRSHSAIAQRFGQSRSAVSEGIRMAAEEVAGPDFEDWLMPPLPAGRPRSGGQREPRPR